jgi:glycosyltransferase involved in cell wall biosynthesis
MKWRRNVSRVFGEAAMSKAGNSLHVPGSRDGEDRKEIETAVSQAETISRQQWNADVLPLVSISCVAYNQKNYIRKAIESFLMQKTTFRVEILLHDDASTDGTADIIREYERLYPDLIFPLYQNKNRYKQGIKISVNFQYPRVRGKYIAKCEGDDFWTDPYKLQKQVVFLERNPEYSACFTNAVILDEIHGAKKIYTRELSEGDIRIEDIIAIGGHIYPSASLVYRKDRLDIDLLRSIPEIAGDTMQLILLALRGKIYFFDLCSCVYRRWNGGVYTSIAKDTRQKTEWRRRRITGYKKLRRALNGSHKKAIKQRISSDSLYVITSTRKLSSIRYIVNLNREDGVRFIRYGIRFVSGRLGLKKLRRSSRSSGG